MSSSTIPTVREYAIRLTSVTCCKEPPPTATRIYLLYKICYYITYCMWRWQTGVKIYDIWFFGFFAILVFNFHFNFIFFLTLCCKRLWEKKWMQENVKAMFPFKCINPSWGFWAHEKRASSEHHLYVVISTACEEAARGLGSMPGSVTKQFFFFFAEQVKIYIKTAKIVQRFPFPIDLSSTSPTYNIFYQYSCLSNQCWHIIKLDILFGFPCSHLLPLFCFRIPSMLAHDIELSRLLSLLGAGFSNLPCLSWPWQLWGVLVWHFIQCPSIRIWYISHDYTEVMYFGENTTRG